MARDHSGASSPSCCALPPARSLVFCRVLLSSASGQEAARLSPHPTSTAAASTPHTWELQMKRTLKELNRPQRNSIGKQKQVARVREIAQPVKDLSTKLDNISLVPRTCMVEREPGPRSCPRTSHMLWQSHTHTMHACRNKFQTNISRGGYRRMIPSCTSQDQLKLVHFN